MRAPIAVVLAWALVCLVGCSHPGPVTVYGAQNARIGESLKVLGWNMSVTNMRWSGDYLLVDVDAAPSDAHGPHAKAEDIRYGMYGALSHPMESTGLGSCDEAVTKVRDITTPLTAPAERLTGTVCLGPLKDRSAVRGVYTYSPRDRIADTVAAYPAAYPVGVLPTNVNDTGLEVRTTATSAWRADGSPVSKAQLGDPAAFTGNGYMLLTLETTAVAERYRDDSARRGGPMMMLATPTLPGRGLTPACAAYGSSVLILPEASRNAVQVSASLCTQGEINQALLYATVAIVGTHAALWTAR